MEGNEIIQASLDYIDDNVREKLNVAALAEAAGYSAFHFSRIFKEAAGISVMAYVTRRKLDFAAHDLSRGGKVIDAAMEYGFETHAGFTKAFVSRFGFPPSLCRLRIDAKPPGSVNVQAILEEIKGGFTMNIQPHIIELTPFSVVGYPDRYKKPSVRRTADAPTFWHTLEMDCAPLLTELYDTFPYSKHFEISMCYDADVKTGEFTYLLGRGIDDLRDLANMKPEMTRVDIEGGLYAVFFTPPVADSYIQAAQDMWNDIFLRWLPQSEFMYDDTRYDFEYHDHRDHGWYFGGKLQIDICIPIRQK